LGPPPQDETIMTTFDKREQDFENRFKHDEELRFKVTARRNKLLGLWAAGRLGLEGAAADAYAETIVAAEFQGGDAHVVDTLATDLAGIQPPVTAAQLRFELEHFDQHAMRLMMEE
jgi:hypothetical protein